ncbi:MAG: hypothetical protein MUE99_10190 [Chitinophagaceae bacterium]|nr:hypothetical protein [Chitinophagaceae bacterium]
MKFVTAIIMIGSIFMSVFAQGVVVLHYFINKKYIAQNLCENRTRPMLHCDGKCVLAKKLQQQESQQKEQGIYFTEKFEVLSNALGFIQAPLPKSFVISNPLSMFRVEPLWSGYRTIFHPPDC